MTNKDKRDLQGNRTSSPIPGQAETRPIRGMAIVIIAHEALGLAQRVGFAGAGFEIAIKPFDGDGRGQIINRPETRDERGRAGKNETAAQPNDFITAGDFGEARFTC